MTEVDSNELARASAVLTFKEIVNEINQSSIKIPSIDRITTFNDKEIIVNFFDKFFAVYEILTYEVGGEEKSNIAAVALGRHEGDGKITLIDFRYIGQEENALFREGIDAFLNLIDTTRLKELPPTELHEGGKMTYEEIINKIAITYVLVKPVVIH